MHPSPGQMAAPFGVTELTLIETFKWRTKTLTEEVLGILPKIYLIIIPILVILGPMVLFFCLGSLVLINEKIECFMFKSRQLVPLMIMGRFVSSLILSDRNNWPGKGSYLCEIVFMQTTSNVFVLQRNSITIQANSLMKH